MTNIDQLLRDQLRHEDGYLDRQIDQWLAEDLTAEYDEMVTTRKPARRRWLLAGVAAAAIVGIVMWLWPTVPNGDAILLTVGAPTEAEQTEVVAASPKESHSELLTDHAVRPLRGRSHTPHTVSRGSTHGYEDSTPIGELPITNSATTADSLDYYLARLEQSLDAVDDSIYEARAEQIIRADERLQRLVQKVYMNELERRQQEQQALYLKY